MMKSFFTNLRVQLFSAPVSIVLSFLLLAGCSGGSGTSGTTSTLQGNAAFRASAIAEYQSLGAGVSYPFAALQLVSPTGSTIHNLSELLTPSLRKSSAAQKSAVSLTASALVFSPALNLYSNGGIFNGNILTVSFYSDAAGTQPAGAMTITLPANLNITDPTSYISYPAIVTIAVNITGGSLPCTGNVQISFSGGTGANSMTGTLTLTNDNVIFNVNLALDDQLNVTGSITIQESGSTVLLTNVQGNVTGTLTCNVNGPNGSTGTGTLDLLTGAMTLNLNTETGTSTAASDSSGNLIINYAGGTQETVNNAMSVGLTAPASIVATGGTVQSTTVNTAFATALQVTVKDAGGNPVNGVTVTFAAPAGGANGSFAGGVTTATTNLSGVAISAVFSANGTTGNYSVTATVAGVATPASFSMTNTAAVNPSSTSFAYVVYFDGISIYSLGANGVLIPTSSTATHVGTGLGDSIAVVPSGRYAYVTNNGGNTISQYTIGTNGALIPMSPATVTAGNDPFSIAINSSGTYAYVTNYNDNTISQYTIGTNGALMPMSPATVAAGDAPYSITINPSGTYAYVTNYNDSTISQYTIGTNGALMPMSPATVSSAGSFPTSIAIAPSGKYVYVTNSDYDYAGDGGNDTVSQYTIGANGALMPMNPATVIAGTFPTSIAINPSGTYVYITNQVDDTISQYTISANGALMPMSPATVATVGLSDPHSISIDPSGKYVYVTNADELISQYTIGTNGALIPMSPATVATSSSSSYIFIVTQ